MTAGDEFVPPERRCTMCDAAAASGETTDEPDGELDADTVGDTDTGTDDAEPQLWDGVGLAETMSDTYPPTLHEREQ
jgi:hypothetical protein